MDPTVLAVLDANEQFYDVFRRADVPGMLALWADDPRIACIHPGWAPLRGSEDVRTSWVDVLTSGPPQIVCSDPTVHVFGDVALVVCFEVMGDTRLVATNVFMRVDGAWRLVHHQAGPVAQPVQIPDAWVN